MSPLKPQQLQELGVAEFYRKLYEATRDEVHRNIDAGSLPTTAALPKVHDSVDLTKGGQAPQAVTMSEILASVSTARVVLVSQYQTLPECRLNVALLLQQLLLQEKTRPIACALDNFAENTQILFNALKTKQLNIAGFEKANQTLANYGARFWQSLQPLLHLQTKTSLQLLAADAESTVVDLRKRDQQTIKVVEKWLQENPHGTCFVLLGERRLMEGAIYEALQRHLGADSKVVMLLQAWEEAYWRLLENHKPTSTALQTPYRWHQQLYTLMAVPPIVKLDSYLTWSQQQEAWPGWPAEPAVNEMRLLISKTLKLPETSLPPIQLYCCGDMALLERIKNLDGLTADEAAALLTQIIRRESFFLPRLNLIYLATLDTYHMGEEVGHSLRLHLSGEQPDKMVWTSRGWLYYSAINEAAGYLASKIVTPGRKPGKKSQKFCQQLADNKKISALESASKEQLMIMGHEAGYGLGEMIYRQLQLGETSLLPLFTKTIRNEDEAQFFFQELYKLASVEKPLRRVRIKKKDTIHKRLHYVGLFYFILFFLPALLWGQTRELFRFPNPLGANLPRDLMVAFATTALVVMLSFVLGRFVRPFRELSIELKRVLGPLTVDQAFLLAAFSGIGEELLFRGVLQAEVGLLFSALLFSILHFVPDRRFFVWPFFAFVVGILLGLSYEFTGNLVVPILGHVLINFCNILLMLKNNKWLQA